MPVEKVFEDLQTSPEGLSSEEAKLRLKKYGQNKLSERKQLPDQGAWFRITPQASSRVYGFGMEGLERLAG